MRGLVGIAVWIAGLGAVVWLGGKILPALAPFQHYAMVAVIGGVAVWILGTVVIR